MTTANRATTPPVPVTTGDGFLVHRETFTPDEVGELRDGVEAAVGAAVARAEHAAAHAPERLHTWFTDAGHRMQTVHGSDARTDLHWEPDAVDGAPVVRNLRPVTHLDARLDRWDDPRLAAPAAALLGVTAVGPLTSKISVKRAHVGSEFVWHQDQSFLATFLGTEHAAQVVTAMVLLDDADADNGALCVVPGTQHGPTRPDHEPPRPGDAEPVRVDAPAGTVVFFPSLLLHRSDANRSDRDRRALFFLYQPAGRPQLDEARPLAGG